MDTIAYYDMIIFKEIQHNLYKMEEGSQPMPIVSPVQAVLDMNSFHSSIVALTIETSERSVLTKHTGELYEMLTNGFVDNIKIAASNGYSMAYLALFSVDAIYRGEARLIDLLFPSEKVIKKCKQYNIVPVYDRICNTLGPFEVSHRVLNPDDQIDKHVYGIIASWGGATNANSEELTM